MYWNGMTLQSLVRLRLHVLLQHAPCHQNIMARCSFLLVPTGFFSDILGAVFFPPSQDGHAAIVESFAVFGKR